MPTDRYQLELSDFSMNDKGRFMRIAIPPEGHPFYVTILGHDPEVAVTAVWPRAMIDQIRTALNAMTPPAIDPLYQEAIHMGLHDLASWMG